METIQDLIISKRKMAIFSLSLLVIKTPLKQINGIVMDSKCLNS